MAVIQRSVVSSPDLALATGLECRVATVETTLGSGAGSRTKSSTLRRGGRRPSTPWRRVCKPSTLWRGRLLASTLWRGRLLASTLWRGGREGGSSKVSQLFRLKRVCAYWIVDGETCGRYKRRHRSLGDVQADPLTACCRTWTWSALTHSWSNQGTYMKS